MNPGSKPDGIWRTPDAYPFHLPLVPHYSHLDTERHVNNVAVQSFHLEARTRLLMDTLDRPVWYSDDVLLRPRRTLTQFLGETHYPHPVTATAAVLGADADSVQNSKPFWLAMMANFRRNTKEHMNSTSARRASLGRLTCSTSQILMPPPLPLT